MVLDVGLEFLFRSCTRRDSFYSWYMTCLCLLILILTNCFVSGMGNLFVVFLNSYGVTREDAAIPLNVMVSATQLSGIISGAILHKLTPRTTLFVVVLTEAFGAFLQFLRPMDSEFTWIIICMILRGIAMGIVPPLLLQVVSTHFEKHRAKALMMVFLAYSISGIVLPFITDYAYETYGLKGSWLIHSAMVVQCLVFVNLVREGSDPLNNAKNAAAVENGSLPNPDDNAISNQEEIASEEFRITGQESSEVETLKQTVVRLLKTPNLYVIVFSDVVGLSSYYFCNMSLVDFALDEGIPVKTASIMLVVHGIGELFGRLPVSWLVDKRIANDEVVVGVIMLLSSALYVLLTLSTGKYFVAVVFFMGLCFGGSQVSRTPLFPSLGVNTTALTYGFSSFVTGVVTLLLPELIGKFRDELQDYKYIYFIFGSFLLLASLVHFYSRLRLTRKVNNSRD